MNSKGIYIRPYYFTYFLAFKVKNVIQLDMMLVTGNYTLSSFFTKADGPFTIVLKKVVVKGNASLAVERDGHIRTQDISMDITFADMSMDFQNLGTVKSLYLLHKNTLRMADILNLQVSWAVFSNRSLIRHQR